MATNPMAELGKKKKYNPDGTIADPSSGSDYQANAGVYADEANRALLIDGNVGRFLGQGLKATGVGAYGEAKQIGEDVVDGVKGFGGALADGAKAVGGTAVSAFNNAFGGTPELSSKAAAPTAAEMREYKYQQAMNAPTGPSANAALSPSVTPAQSEAAKTTAPTEIPTTPTLAKPGERTDLSAQLGKPPVMSSEAASNMSSDPSMNMSSASASPPIAGAPFLSNKFDATNNKDVPTNNMARLNPNAVSAAEFSAMGAGDRAKEARAAMPMQPGQVGSADARSFDNPMGADLSKMRGTFSTVDSYKAPMFRELRPDMGFTEWANTRAYNANKLAQLKITSQEGVDGARNAIEAYKAVNPTPESQSMMRLREAQARAAEGNAGLEDIKMTREKKKIELENTIENETDPAKKQMYLEQYQMMVSPKIKGAMGEGEILKSAGEYAKLRDIPLDEAVGEVRKAINMSKPGAEKSTKPKTPVPPQPEEGSFMSKNGRLRTYRNGQWVDV